MGRSRPERVGAKSGADVGAKLSQGIGFSLISLFESMADGFVGAKPDFRKRAPEREPRDPNAFDAVIDEARKRQRIEEEEADEGIAQASKVPPGTSRGSRPATLASPDYLATKKTIEKRPGPSANIGAVLIRAAARQLADRQPALAVELDDDAGIELEIDRLYRTKLATIRHMPRRERIHAVRAARLWNDQALAAPARKA